MTQIMHSSKPAQEFSAKGPSPSPLCSAGRLRLESPQPLSFSRPPLHPRVHMLLHSRVIRPLISRYRARNFGLHCLFSLSLAFFPLLGNSPHSGFSLLQNAQAGGTLLIPLSTAAKRPAADLLYQGRRIDPNRALEVARSGVALWQLDPQPSELWGPEPQDPDLGEQLLPPEAASVRFDSFKASVASPRMFRAAVDGTDLTTLQPKEYTLVVGLNNAASAIRASLLRQIGYRVDPPKIYSRLRVTFDSVSRRDEFLRELADRSTTSRDRWVVSQEDAPPSVLLRGVMLEPGRPTNQALHLGIMLAPLQRERRIFRATLATNLLLDLPENINAFSWELGRLFNRSVWLDYYQAENYPDVTIDDLRWIIAKLAHLPRNAWIHAVAAAHLPEEISSLLVEKIISRHQSLLHVTGLAPRMSSASSGPHPSAPLPSLPFDPHLNHGPVQNGQLTADPSGDSPYHFYATPAAAPLRFSQMWRYFLSETLSTAMGAGLGFVSSNLISPQTDSSAASRHADRVSRGIEDYIFRTGGIQGLNQPVGLWVAPTVGANVGASRNVVAGSVMGSDSQVQLVDQFSVSLNTGFTLAVDGLAPYLVPTGGGGVSLARTYSHIKPIGDVNEALRTQWTRILVPEFMVGLSGVLNPNLNCTLPHHPWTTPFELNGKTYTRINYDSPPGSVSPSPAPSAVPTPGAPPAPALTPHEEALQLRARLIAEGTPEDRIVLTAVDRAAECQKEENNFVNQALEQFANRLAVGEQFMITDSIRSTLRLGVSVSPTPILTGLNATAQGEGAEEFARATTIRKVQDGFEFYLQDRRLDQVQLAFDLNFYLNLFNYTLGQRWGHAHTRFYKVITEGASQDVKLHLMRALRALLVANNAEILTDHFRPYELFHDLAARFSRLRFLFWSRDRSYQDHRLTIYPPSDRPEENQRHFRMARNVLRAGKDLFGFVASALRPFTGGVTLGGGQGGDPGNAPGGQSFTSSVSSQAEILGDGRLTRPVTLIEQTHRGWSINKSRLFNIFSAIEARFGALQPQLAEGRGATRSYFNRNLFHQMQTLQLYQIDSTLVIYPEALEQIRASIFERLGGQAPSNQPNRLLNFEPNSSWVRFCDSSTPPAVRTQLTCNPEWVNYAIWLRNRGYPAGERNQLVWFNNLFVYLLNHGALADFLAELDTQTYFFVTRASGFMRGDANGGLLYLSDTIGRFEGERGMGLYRELATFTGISLFEIYGRFFTDGL